MTYPMMLAPGWGSYMMRVRRLRVLPKRAGVALLCLVLLTAAVPAGAQTSGHRSHAAHHSIHLTWNPSNTKNKVVGYNIYRSIAGYKHFRKLNSSPIPKPEYDDATVHSGTTYLYVVKSVDAKGGESGPSNRIRLSVPR